jgi:hypothetical protein
LLNAIEPQPRLGAGVVSLDRITGEVDDFNYKDIDWRKCKVKKVERKSFTWIPRQTQQ